ncbi:MAG: hypothetical protein ACXACX_08390 [Candidatus Hodarchaeales archaeon]
MISNSSKHFTFTILMWIFVFVNFFFWMVFVTVNSRILSDLSLLILIFQLLVVLATILVTAIEFSLYINYKYKKYKFEYDKIRMEDISRIVKEFKLFERKNIVY